MLRTLARLDSLPPPSVRVRIGLGVLAGVFGAWLCWFWGGSPYDFSWPLRAAADLLAGRDPYAYPFHALAVPYPLPAAFVGLLFQWLPPEAAGILFFGISSGLLVAGLLRHGYAGVLVLLSGPYSMAAQFVQWSPLIAAAACFVWLQPLILVKPQIAIPVVLPYLQRRGMLLIALVGLISLIIYPTWPQRWLSQIGEYERFLLLLVLPFGPLLLLALLRWRDPRAQTLVLAALMPQRAMYDLVILWTIPRRWLDMMLVVFCSWLWVLELPLSEAEKALLCAYLPMLAVLLLQRAGTPKMVS